jgi:hypothetical protein
MITKSERLIQQDGVFRPQGWQGWIGVVFWIGVAAVIIAWVRALLAIRK